MFKSMVLCAGVLAMGCGGWQENTSRHYELFIDPTFSDQQAATIIEAATEWQKATNNWITFSGTTVDTGDDTISFYALSDADQIHSQCDGDPNAIGCEFSDGVKEHIYMETDNTDMTFFRQIAGHEAGHALGMPHIGSGNLLCADTGCAALTVQCGDIQELATVWANDGSGHSFDPSMLDICQSK